MGTAAENAALDAAKRCCERWGISKVTIDDIAAEAGISRATLYRLFPGGKDVLFDALRVRDTEEFLIRLRAHVAEATGFEDMLVRCVVQATVELRNDEHLALMLASEPGETANELTVSGLPRIIRIATLFLVPLVEKHLERREAIRLVELLARLVISFFLAPSDHVDLGDPDSAASFVRHFILPAFHTSLRS